MLNPVTELNKVLMRNDNLTQKELARLIGISPQFLNDILKGNRPPAEAVLKYLGLERRVTYVRKVNGNG